MHEEYERQNKIKFYYNEFKKICKGNFIDKRSFFKLYKKINPRIDEKRSNFVYRGIDFVNHGKISKTDFINFTKIFVYGDEVAYYKILFRALDNKRKASLGHSKVVLVGNIINRRITRAELRRILKQETGKDTGSITFPVFYKIFTGRDVNVKTDPYDGKIAKKSLCCTI